YRHSAPLEPGGKWRLGFYRDPATLEPDGGGLQKDPNKGPGPAPSTRAHISPLRNRSDQAHLELRTEGHNRIHLLRAIAAEHAKTRRAKVTIEVPCAKVTIGFHAARVLCSFARPGYLRRDRPLGFLLAGWMVLTGPGSRSSPSSSLANSEVASSMSAS